MTGAVLQTTLTVPRDLKTSEKRRMPLPGGRVHRRERSRGLDRGEVRQTDREAA